MARTTIAVDPGVRDRLKGYGLAGDTYDDILARLMDNMDREAFFAQARRVLRDPDVRWTDIDDLA